MSEDYIYDHESQDYDLDHQITTDIVAFEVEKSING